MMRSVLTVTIGILSWLIIAGTSNAGVVTNGGFEEPLVPYESGFTIFGSVPGWLWTGENGIEVHRFLNGWLPFEGSQYVEATNQGDTYQVLPTIAGAHYTLDYAYSPRPGVALNPLDVYWDGQLVAHHDISGLANNNTAWTAFSFDLTASSNVTLLEFRAPRVDVGSFVDAVEVQQAVPLPRTVWIGLVGCIAIFVQSRLKARTGTLLE